MPVYGNLRRAGRGFAVAAAAGLLALSTAMPAAAATIPARTNLLSSDCPSTVKQGQFSGCVTELQTLLDDATAAMAAGELDPCAGDGECPAFAESE